MEETFNLRLNDQGLLSKKFNKLMTQANFYDVTIVGDDLKPVSAHKVVLSASSEYFSHILSAKNQANTLVCLPGANSHMIKCLIDFMYLGEVEIKQSNVTEFMRMAQNLKVEGLLFDMSSVDEAMKQSKDQDITTLNSPKIFNDTSSSINETKHNVSGQIVATQNEYNQFEDKTKGLSLNEEVKIEHEVYETNYSRLHDGTFVCKVCGKTSTNSRTIKEHIEIHLEGVSFMCRCGKSFGTRSNLRGHQRYCPLKKVLSLTL